MCQTLERLGAMLCTTRAAPVSGSPCLSAGMPTGVIRSLHEMGRLEHTFCTETRPYNQGARLTAFELVYEQIPATLITDSMAAAAMAHWGVSGQWAGHGGAGNASGIQMCELPNSPPPTLSRGGGS